MTTIPPLLREGDDDGTQAIAFKQALEQRYLAYALSTITNRALPDVRDGLKPVHRRLLYAMRQLRLDPTRGFKKSARVVGDVIGRYHPHGDQAVYDSLVRLAQGFAMRYPLIDGQGNFGNVDGDNPAAMRYTEARMTDIAQLLLEDIDSNTVNFRSTYDGEDEEPVVLPAAFPNLLANGAAGIAVGMATFIPPHNVYELCGAGLHLIRAPNARLEKLLRYVRGPDFPTGGICIEAADKMAQAYAEGRGSFRVRARYEVEDLGRGQWQIVIVEIPYQVQKSRLIERIAEMMSTRSLPMLEDIRDESTEDIRLVLIPKSRHIVPTQMMATLFRQTDLEVRVSLNMNVLDSTGVPRVMGLVDLLRAWLDHRKAVLLRKSRDRLSKIAVRLEVFDGYLIAYLNLDEIIAIIREADDPRSELIVRFELNEVQTDAILNMRLRTLRKLEEANIRDEHATLSAERAMLVSLVANDDAQWAVIADELKALRKAYGPKTVLGARRTDFEVLSADEETAPEILVVKEPITVICSAKGWVRAMKTHIETGDSLSYKDGDERGFVLRAHTTDRLILFTASGRGFTLDASRLPGGRGMGDPLRLMLDIPPDDDILEIFVHDSARHLLVASAKGYGFCVPESELVSMRRVGRQILNLAGDDCAVVCVPAIGDMVAVLGTNQKLLCFERTELPQMRRGRGVRLQRHHQGKLADARIYTRSEGLILTDRKGQNRRFSDLVAWHGARAQAGKVRPKGFPAGGRMGFAFANRL